MDAIKLLTFGMGGGGLSPLTRQSLCTPLSVAPNIPQTGKEHGEGAVSHRLHVLAMSQGNASRLQAWPKDINTLNIMDSRKWGSNAVRKDLQPSDLQATLWLAGCESPLEQKSTRSPSSCSDFPWESTQGAPRMSPLTKPLHLIRIPWTSLIFKHSLMYNLLYWFL